MQRSSIEWTNFTSNPIKYRYLDGTVVWACVHASPGCLHCYSEQIALRYRRGKLFNVANMKEVTPFLDEKELHSILTYKPAAGQMCFLGDMTDIFGEWVPDDVLNRLFSNCLELRTDVTFQILTKRAERMQKYLSWRWGEGRIVPRNIWLGVSVENQEYADRRIPLLLQTPAAVHFVSYEPALGEINFQKWFWVGPEGGIDFSYSPSQLIDWLIIGGESGPGARPLNIRWVRDLVVQCSAAKVPLFVKQFGAVPMEHPAQIREWPTESQRRYLAALPASKPPACP